MLAAYWVKRLLSLALSILVIGGGLGGGAAALAANPDPEAIAPDPALPSLGVNATDIPSEKVDQFVSAYLSVVQLIDDRTEDLQRAESEAESLRLQRTIEADAFGLIQAAGLTRQDYFQLLGLANTDPEFRDRVLAQLEERDR
ncbi:MAG TPA: DUF4168 domain-containing protein [Candidatus Obscuribacterales bacterium]